MENNYIHKITDIEVFDLTPYEVRIQAIWTAKDDGSQPGTVTASQISNIMNNARDIIDILRV